MDYSERYLIMVTPNNNNKYYKMVVNGDTWTAEYGRIGASSQRKVYPISSWEKKYNEKIRKGYVDQTDLKQELIAQAPKDNSDYKEIENRAIREIVERLQRMAREVVRANYRVSSNDVTQKMVDTAQRKLNELMYCTDIRQFNDALLELFTIIPRRMGNVSEFLARTPSDFNPIIAKEQCLLDTVRGQVRVAPDITADTPKNERKNQTILEAICYDISRTELDYEHLMHQWREEIGNLLYEADKHGCDIPKYPIHFFGYGAKESFQELLICYIFLNFLELTQSEQKETIEEKWILTDEDTFQYRRRLKDGVYERYQIGERIPAYDSQNDERFGVIHTVVDISEIDIEHTQYLWL